MNFSYAGHSSALKCLFQWKEALLSAAEALKTGRSSRADVSEPPRTPARLRRRWGRVAARVRVGSSDGFACRTGPVA